MGPLCPISLAGKIQTPFFVPGVVLYLSIPYTAWKVSASPAEIWLVYFYAATMIIFTMYGGGFATIPACLSDLFGTKKRWWSPWAIVDRMEYGGHSRSASDCPAT